MKHLMLALLFFCLTCSANAQQRNPIPEPTPLYRAVKLKDILEVISQAKREIWLLAPTLRQAEVYRALRSRVESGVILRLLIADRKGYTGFERFLARAPNVDARWLPERFGAALLIVDDRLMVTSSLISGLNEPSPSLLVTRPEIIAAASLPIKQVFARARKLK
jgi:hypothetical protein